ncbi:altronate dehydratase [Petrocella atlantisensis]|uniref:Altronate dehydratase n=1 Tax=Petrocella atlantisensis TaxID=2173034 RepID=A0A3P7PUV1_9FIRM|nr:altronate dehydratase family protein [Petrocella atlantisensis]VDN47717.1 altronate dehydratase [Petrocella atlantisensis]
MNKHYVIHNRDNVYINLEEDDSKNLIRGHKYALKDIKKDEAIIKYGMPIGIATCDILKGEHIHTHNLKTSLGDILSYNYQPEKNNDVTLEASVSKIERKTVKVYERMGQEVGIRNELWIIPTVGCVNGVSNRIIDVFKSRCMEEGIDLNRLDNFDGIYAYTHNYGCSQMGDDHINTRKTLQNITKHPNAGGVLVIGLGCENNQIKDFEESLGTYDKSRVRFLISQEVEDEIEAGYEMVRALFDEMLKDQRVEKPLSSIRVGLECGGSDGLSGITANPLIGRFSDYLVEQGGTTVLTEVPEMFGAETILMNRCVNREVFDKMVEMVNDFKNYYKKHNQVIYDNPSPGNKSGGISSLEDKSLGCTTKAGDSLVMDVLKHTERLKTPGLNLISAPGNDAVATTTLGMCGCHMVLFSTGRGTPFGGFVPTVKISTNTPLFEKKPNWIDFNAGQLVDGLSMDAILEQFTEKIIATINGAKTRQELNNYREIAIFKTGVTL